MMKCLSLSQPWCWAMLDEVAAKHIENRSWAPPIADIGHDGWVLTDVRALGRPIPAAGKQGFWRLDDAQESAVREQMAVAA